jgi:membrane protein implicated in regulation of membrane protease activity
MDTPMFLQWQYLIFVLPCGLAALLLLLSSLHLGHHAGHGGGRMHAPAHSGHLPAAPHAAHGPGATHPQPQAGHGQGGGGHASRASGARSHSQTARHAAKPGERQESDRPNVSVTTNFVLHLTGADRAPLIMILEVFCLVWGMGGYLANRALLHAANPTPRDILPSLAVALCAGLIGARFGAEILARVMPKEESLDISREGLFGLTGNVAFAVTDTAGRIHIYDRYGTLHDEMCRVQQGHPGIAKGHRAMVVDMDTQGMLIVEEIPASVK